MGAVKLHLRSPWKKLPAINGAPPGSRAAEGGSRQGKMVEAYVFPAAFVIDGNEAAAEVKAACVPER